MDNIPFENKKDFLVYVLLYVANIDGEITFKEFRKVINTYGYDSYARVVEQFENDNDYEQLQKIEAFKKHFSESGLTAEELMEKIKEIFLSDGKFSDLERVFYHRLKGILS